MDLEKAKQEFIKYTNGFQIEIPNWFNSKIKYKEMRSNERIKKI